MKNSTFLVQLLITSLIAFAIAVISQQFVMEEDHFPFLIVEIVVFIISAFIIHLLGRKASKSTNKYVFSQLTMTNSFVKLFIIVSMVAVYKTELSPDSNSFVWPFISIYVIYTIFETGFLFKLARL